MTETVKFLIVVLSLLVLQMHVSADVRKQCRKESNVSWAALKKLKAGDFNQDDQNLKCYLKCFMVKNGISSEDNKIDIPKALRHLPRKLQDSSRKTLEICKNMQGKDSCDTAFQIAKCYFKAQPEILDKIAFV